MNAVPPENESSNARMVAHPPHEPLLFAFWCVCAGILIDCFCDVTIQVWVIALTAALAMWWIAWLRRNSFSWLPLGIAIAAGFGGWHHVYWNFYPANQIVTYAAVEEAPVCIRGVMLRQPRNVLREEDPIAATIDPREASFEFVATELRHEHGAWLPVTGRCRGKTRGHVQGIRAGDEVTIFGRLSKAEPPVNPGAWDPSHHARTHRLLCRLSVAHPDCMTLDRAASGWNPRWWLSRLRSAMELGLLKHVDGKAGALAVAVLLGARDHVARSQVDTFLTTGTVHLLAISGLHVGILAFSMLYALTMLRSPRSFNLWIVMLFCLIYACLTGGRAPVIRATVIVWVACLGLLWYRPNFSFNSLAAAGIIVLAINPAQLFAPGAQLSFVAVASIIWIVPKISDRTAGRVARLIHRKRKSLFRMAFARRLRKTLTVAVASMVIWFVAMPLVMYYFHIVSPIALVLNTFAWIPLSIALLSGFVTMVFCWLPTSWLVVPATTCRWSLEGLTSIVEFADQLPLSHFWVAGPPLWAVLGFYVVIAVCLALPQVRRRWVHSLAVAILVFVAFWCTHQVSLHRRFQPLEVTFLSVGHGTCVVMALPGDAAQRDYWIYDAGRLGSSRYAVQEISNFLWSRGTNRIAGLVLSHADVDHFNAIPGLVDRFDVGDVYMTRSFLQSAQPAAKILMSALAEHQIPVSTVAAGDKIAASAGIEFEVLHPHQAFEGESDNSQSIVLSLEHQARRILLPGDLEGSGMDALLADGRTDFDLVMAPHHGSHHSDPEKFCAWSRPEWVVISGGNARSVKKGKRIFENHGAIVLQTTREGAIGATIHRGEISITHQRWVR